MPSAAQITLAMNLKGSAQATFISLLKQQNEAEAAAEANRPRTPTRTADSLASTQYATFLDLISEGEIEGFPSAAGLTKGTNAYNIAALKDIYLNKKETKAIVHAHSSCATAISTHGKSIPAFHYMVAMAGGNDIKCAKYATYGTRELSKNILKALRQRNACLIGNHGQIAFSENLSKAFELAEEVENLSNQYITALKIGKPKILSSREMSKVLSKAKNYKRG